MQSKTTKLSLTELITCVRVIRVALANEQIIVKKLSCALVSQSAKLNPLGNEKTSFESSVLE